MFTRLPEVINNSDWNVGKDNGIYGDEIDFNTSLDITLLGISLFGDRQDPKMLTGKFEILERGSDKVLASQKFTYNSFTRQDYQDSFFASPVSIIAGNTYSLFLEYFNRQAYLFYGSGGRKISTVGCLGQLVTWHVWKDESSIGSSNYQSGQFPRLLFSCDMKEEK